VLSPATLELLAEAGWSPARSVDISAEVRHLSRIGYRVSAAAEQFLRSFLGLTIRRPCGTSEDTLDIIPAEAASRVWRDRVRTYESFLGVELCPVGSYFTWTFTLLMAPDGVVYGGADDTLRWLGGSGAEAVENLLTRHQSRLLRGG
jgi:hypothetical protein